MFSQEIIIEIVFNCHSMLCYNNIHETWSWHQERVVGTLLFHDAHVEDYAIGSNKIYPSLVTYRLIKYYEEHRTQNQLS